MNPNQDKYKEKHTCASPRFWGEILAYGNIYRWE
jgi:hypothetical protein